MTKNIEQSILKAIKDALQYENEIKSDSIAQNIDGWDSIGHLSIIVALDHLFDGKVACITEVSEADSVPKILELLRRNALL